MTIRNCRADFEFDAATRKFIAAVQKRLQKQKPVREEKLSVVPTKDGYHVVSINEMEKCGWIRKW